MKTHKVRAGGHDFEIRFSIWSGREEILVDGRVLSQARSYMVVTPHVFVLREGGEDVVYEVNVISSLSLGAGYVIRRNGIAIAHATA